VYYEKNADALKAKSAQFRCEQPERARAHVSAWITRNRSKKRAKDREYHREHVEERREYNSRPERRAAHRANAKTQKAKRKAAIEATIEPITAEQWEDLKASYLWLCVYCLEKCDDLTMDHVVALNRGGDHTVGNVVPACRTCNREKTDKSMIVFLAERRIAA
jgi:5-methylcytosine-specific restriction endonuclease McrA